MDWDLALKVLGYVSGPLIGAIIGIFTNYIAVKMLFRPYTQKKIFGLPMPFTPGIIPKRRGALASAIGRAVGEELFTGDDIKNMLCAPEVESMLVEAISLKLEGSLERPLDELLLSVTDEVGVQAIKDNLSFLLAERLVGALRNMDIAEIVATRGKEAIVEKRASLGLLGAFLSDGVIDPLLDEVRAKITSFIDESGTDTALVAIKGELDSVCVSSVSELLDTSKIDTRALVLSLKPLYEEAVVRTIEYATESLDICAIVESKINQMDIRELEALCLRIMKRELNAVIYLGGVIGLLLGVINIFI